MSSYTPRPCQVFDNLGYFYQEKPEPVKEKFYTYVKDEALIAPVKGSFNIVMSRDIRKNVHISADMAVGMAKSLGEKQVIVYVNTYAGVRLMQEAFSAARLKHGYTEVAPVPQLDEQGKIIPDPMLQDNLALVHCPMGNCDLERVKEYIHDESPNVIVIINSFEYAALNRGRRMKLSEQLVDLRETWDLTFLVFTHEKKNDVRPGYPARGAIGVLSGNAGSVWSLKDEFELLQESKLAARTAAKEQLIAARERALAEKASKQAEIKAVHENKTRAPRKERWHEGTGKGYGAGPNRQYDAANPPPFRPLLV